MSYLPLPSSHPMYSLHAQLCPASPPPAGLNIIQLDHGPIVDGLPIAVEMSELFTKFWVIVMSTAEMFLWPKSRASLQKLILVIVKAVPPIHLVISHSHGKSPFLIGKPSISMGHLYHGYVSHNQMVRLWSMVKSTINKLDQKMLKYWPEKNDDQSTCSQMFPLSLYWKQQFFNATLTGQTSQKLVWFHPQSLLRS